jgi:hypothetical protein
MAFPEYRLKYIQKHAGVHETDKRSYPMSKLLPFAKVLEDEIHDLRKKMEQLVDQESSFTSEAVVEMSSILDCKINEYMKLNQRSR